ncbi:MAG TPA: signal peptidase II, partial [Phototrophicaceae bacterium]|nr:signal peptidase II [Phototrophicaceae bacterium]
MRKWLELVVIVGLVLAADRFTKQWVMDNLQIYETRAIVPALSPFFQITRSQNTGAAFGFLPEASSLFLFIALAVVIGMIFFYPRIPANAPLTRIATARAMNRN